MADQTIEKMNEAQIAAELEKHPDWSEVGGKIQRTFQFPDFVASIEFVKKLAAYAEKVQHHPDILIRYDKVTLTVSTHDAGGITQKDFDLAQESDKLSK
jgi:4a-hydroxytetrahydrobiopterin dehydratase